MTPPTVYLDNASTSWPKPQRVIDEMVRFMAEDGGSPGRGGYRQAVAAERIVRDVRVKLSRFINADDPSRIIHCLNGTDALNMALKGSLREGDHVVCTQLDHNSVSRPLEALAIQYAHLGTVYGKRGDLRAARENWTSSRDLYARIGMPHMVEKVQSALDGLP